ncbi:MAG: hypothetical protein K1000chlam2_01675 [Chlamydiae bacterium]|nr:hypothetical protein [Chlamydiota bacterium]
MLIEFPKNSLKSLPPEEAPYAYARITDNYLQLEKSQSKLEFLHFKYLGFFFVSSFIFFILQCHGVLPNCLIGIIISGIGTLIAIAFTIIFLSIPYDKRLSKHISAGKELEEHYPSILESKIFKSIDALKIHERAAMWHRVLISQVVGIFTAVAGTLYALQINPVSSILVSVLSTTGLICSAVFLVRTTKKAYHKSSTN